MTAEPWIALALTALAVTISIITSNYQSGQAKNAAAAAASAAAAAEKTRADLSDLKLQIVERVDTKLTDFVQVQRLKDYIEGHSKEHITIREELTRLRDWKDQMDGDMRTTKNSAAEMANAVDDIKRIVRDIKTQAST